MVELVDRGRVLEMKGKGNGGRKEKTKKQCFGNRNKDSHDKNDDENGSNDDMENKRHTYTTT